MPPFYRCMPALNQIRNCLFPHFCAQHVQTPAKQQYSHKWSTMCNTAKILTYISSLESSEQQLSCDVCALWFTSEMIDLYNFVPVKHCTSKNIKVNTNAFNSWQPGFSLQNWIPVLNLCQSRLSTTSAAQ